MNDFGNARTIKNSAAKPKRKWWGESITIWGALITAAATVIPLAGRLAGIEISGDFIREVGQDLVIAMQLVAGLIGTLMALYGRARATRQLERRAINLVL